MPRKSLAALSGALGALALLAPPARTQDYEMLWGPPRTPPPAMTFPRSDYPFFRPPWSEGRSFRPFRKRAHPGRAGASRKPAGDHESARPKPRLSQAGSGAYRTLCVRTCDGYYWPISYATPQARFGSDEKSCRASCPNQKVALYTHCTEGQGSDDAVSLEGKAMSALKHAFLYRQEYKPECACKHPQPLVAAKGAPKRHAKAGAGPRPANSERKDRKGTVAHAEADPGTTGSVGAEPDKNAGSSAEAGKPEPARRVRLVGPPFLVDR